MTIATAFPSLEVLAKKVEVEKIILTTVEREGQVPSILKFNFTHNQKIIFEPLYSKNKVFNLLNKIYDFIYFPKNIKRLVSGYKVDKVISRGAPAGALVYLALKNTGVPYFVESFEPHADYMLESGVWKRYDPRYYFQKKWEEAIKQFANGLMPVSKKFEFKLINDGIASSRIYTVPVPVDLIKFQHNLNARYELRFNLKFNSNDVVGIYVGKFGGLYYDEEAFLIFKKAFDYFKFSFKLIVLTPNPYEEVLEKFKSIGVFEKQIYIGKVPHNEVPKYLSASDFAFSFMRSTKNLAFASPTKNGEYWANGLPILISEGVGDDSDIIKNEGGGAIIDRSFLNIESAFDQIQIILNDENHKSKLRGMAERYRSIDYVVSAYNTLIFNQSS